MGQGANNWPRPLQSSPSISFAIWELKNVGVGPRPKMNHLLYLQPFIESLRSKWKGPHSSNQTSNSFTRIYLRMLGWWFAWWQAHKNPVKDLTHKMRQVFGSLYIYAAYLLSEFDSLITFGFSTIQAVGIQLKWVFSSALRSLMPNTGGGLAWCSEYILLFSL